MDVNCKHLDSGEGFVCHRGQRDERGRRRGCERRRFFFCRLGTHRLSKVPDDCAECPDREPREQGVAP